MPQAHVAVGADTSNDEGTSDTEASNQSLTQWLTRQTKGFRLSVLGVLGFRFVGLGIGFGVCQPNWPNLKLA